MGTDDLGVVPQIEKTMGVIERRIGAHTHELLRADLNDGNAGIIVKVRNGMIGHSMHLGWQGRRTQSTRRGRLKCRAPYWRGALIPEGPPEAPPATWLFQIKTNLSFPRNPPLFWSVFSPKRQ